MPTTTTTTQIPWWMQEQFQGTFGAINQFTDPILARGSGPSADTTAGQDMLRNWAGSANPFATQDFGVASDYTVNPQSDVFAGPISAAMVGNVGDIQARGGHEFRPNYTDPYLKEVVDTSLDDFDTGVSRNLNALKAQYGASGAFGGSRHGVAEGTMLGESARGRASLSAGLRSDAFRFGTEAGMQDASRALQASQSNQGTQLQRALNQASLNQGANMFNAGNRQSANIFNNNFGENQRQFYAGQQLSAQQTNAGNILRNRELFDQGGSNRAGALLASGAGQDAQGWQALQARLNALGAMGPAFGQTSTTTGGGTDRTLNTLGQLGSTAAMMAMAFCWVAREVYGAENPRWLTFREWMLTKAPRWLRMFYLKHGPNIATWIRDKPRVKSAIRRAMDWCIGA